MIKANFGNVVIKGDRTSVLAEIACIIYSYKINHDNGEDLRKIIDLAMEENEEEFTDRLQNWIDQRDQELTKVEKISYLIDQLLKELEDDDDVEDDEEDQQ